MRSSTLLAVLALASAATAQQMPMPPFNSFFTSSLTRGFFFQCPVNCVVTGLSVPDITDPFQVIELIDFGAAAAPPAYPATVVGTQLFYDNSTAAQSIIATAIPLVAGNYYGVLGAGNATVGSATSQNPYSTTQGIFASSVLGIATDIARLGTQSGIGANGGNQPMWSEMAGTISRVDVYVSSGGGASIATVEGAGTGCTEAYTSIYDGPGTPGNSFDGTNISYTSTMPGQLVIVDTANGSGFEPVGTLAAATAAVLTDDSQSPVGTLGVTVGSNGWVAFGAGNSNSYIPAVGTMLGNPAEGFYFWRDMNPSAAGSGQVMYEEAGTEWMVTYDGVFDFGGTTPDNYVQVRGDTATGMIAVRIDLMSAQGTLFGYSPAGQSLDPGATDLLNMPGGVAVLEGTDIAPLTLTAIGRPVQGGASVNFDVTTSNIDANALFHVGLIGLNNPALPLSSVGFGSGDCFLNAAMDLLVGPVVVAGSAGAPVTWTAMTLPAAPPTFNGFEFYLQAVTLDLGVLSPGGRSSNGLKCTVGDL
jgi:hypothetical protein